MTGTAFAPGSLQLGDCCCAACCGSGGAACCTLPNLSALAANAPVSTIDSSPDTCVWLTVGGSPSLKGKGDGRVWVNGATPGLNVVQAPTNTGCMGLSAVTSTPALGDTAAIGFFVAVLQAVGDGTNTDVKYSPSQGGGVVSLGTFAGPTHTLEVDVCGGLVSYVVDGVDELQLSITLFPALQAAVAIHSFVVHMSAANGGALTSPADTCAPLPPPVDESDNLLLNEGGNVRLMDGGLLLLGG